MRRTIQHYSRLFSIFWKLVAVAARLSQSSLSKVIRSFPVIPEWILIDCSGGIILGNKVHGSIVTIDRNGLSLRVVNRTCVSWLRRRDVGGSSAVMMAWGVGGVIPALVPVMTAMSPWVVWVASTFDETVGDAADNADHEDEASEAHASLNVVVMLGERKGLQNEEEGSYESDHFKFLVSVRRSWDISRIRISGWSVPVTWVVIILLVDGVGLAVSCVVGVWRVAEWEQGYPWVPGV